MSLQDKLKNASTSDWLFDGLSEEEIKNIKMLAHVALKIESKRKEMGMNQKEFAAMMGVSQGMVSKWESGEYNFTISTLNSICTKLNLTFSPSITETLRISSGQNFTRMPIKITPSSQGASSNNHTTLLRICSKRDTPQEGLA